MPVLILAVFLTLSGPIMVLRNKSKDAATYFVAGVLTGVGGFLALTTAYRLFGG